jgi:hypothetical protein
VWVARLDHVVHAFFRSRDALLLMDFSSRRVHDVMTRRAKKSRQIESTLAGSARNA